MVMTVSTLVPINPSSGGGGGGGGVPDDGSVTTPKLVDGAVTSLKIADGAIVNADVSASAGIATTKLAPDPLARANHTGSQLAATISNFDAQVRTNRLDQMAVPTAPVNLNGQDITNANWAGTAIPITAGGTGATTAAGARGNLGIMSKYNATIGDGTSTSFTLNHGLNRTAVAVEYYEVATGETVTARTTRLSSTQIRVDMTPAPAAGAIGVIAWA